VQYEMNVIISSSYTIASFPIGLASYSLPVVTAHIVKLHKKWTVEQSHLKLQISTAGESDVQ